MAQKCSQNSWTANLQISQKTSQTNKSKCCLNQILEGGLHGHLALVVPASLYNKISGCHFAKHIHAGILTIPDGSALHNVIRFCKEHIQQLNHFHETLAVENALQRQIIGAIDSTYIKELINPSTETILYHIMIYFDFVLSFFLIQLIYVKQIRIILSN